MMGKGISVLPCHEPSCNEARWQSEGCQHSVKQVVDSLWPSRPALLATASAAVAEELQQVLISPASALAFSSLVSTVLVSTVPQGKSLH